MKMIVVTVQPDGNVTIEAVGCEGPACIEETKDFEAALGSAKARVLKPRYYQKKSGKLRLKNLGDS